MGKKKCTLFYPLNGYVMGLGLIRGQNTKALNTLINKYASWSHVQHFIALFNLPLTNLITLHVGA
jgi:hypothetical protein